MRISYPTMPAAYIRGVVRTRRDLEKKDLGFFGGAGDKSYIKRVSGGVTGWDRGEDILCFFKMSN